MLNLIDEFTRECLAIRPRRRPNSGNAIEVLADATIEYGMPERICSDNEVTQEGSEEVAGKCRAKTLYIEPGSPWGERLLREFQLEAARRVSEW
jgi:putative transposase